MYARVKNEPYLKDNNLREILNFSGEVLGTFDWHIDEKGTRTKKNIVLENNCYFITEDMIPGKINSKQDVVFNISENKIQYKTSENFIKEKILKYHKLKFEYLRNGDWVVTMKKAQELADSRSMSRSMPTINDTILEEWLTWLDNQANKHTEINWAEINLKDINLNNSNLFLPLPDYPAGII